MEGTKRRLLGLCLPPVLFCLLDAAVTLLGQSAQYWAGNYAQVNEGSPTFHDLLQIHPAAFAVGTLVWIMVFVVGILLLPGTLALIVSIVVTFGHTAGAATWLWGRFHGYQTCLGLFLISAIVLGVGIRWGWLAVPEQEYRLRGWASFARWGMVSMLFGVGVYLFLWPRSPSGHDISLRNNGLPRIVDAIATTDRELEQLGNVHQVTRLYLIGPEITGKGLEHLEQMPQLRSLKLREVQVKDVGLKHLVVLSELEWLNLDRVEIADAELEYVKGLTKLKVLSLSGPQVTDVWLKHLVGMSQLQHLDIADTKVTDAGLEYLKELNQLRTLNLVGTLVSSDGLECLKGMSQLESLYVGETKITDTGLEYLQGLNQLRYLNLVGTNCTSEGKKKLNQILTKCRIAR